MFIQILRTLQIEIILKNPIERKLYYSQKYPAVGVLPASKASKFQYNKIEIT